MCGDPYEDRSAQPRSSPRMNRMFGRRAARRPVAARNGRSWWAVPAAVAGPAAPTARVPAAAVAPTRPPKARREMPPVGEIRSFVEESGWEGDVGAAAERVTERDLPEGYAGEVRPGRARDGDARSQGRSGVKSPESAGTFAAPHPWNGGVAHLTPHPGRGAREKRNGACRTRAATGRISREEKVKANAGESGVQPRRTQRQMALATRPRSTWRRCTKGCGLCMERDPVREYVLTSSTRPPGAGPRTRPRFDPRFG